VLTEEGLSSRKKLPKGTKLPPASGRRHQRGWGEFASTEVESDGQELAQGEKTSERRRVREEVDILVRRGERVTGRKKREG